MKLKNNDIVIYNYNMYIYVTKQLCIAIVNHVDSKGVTVRGVEWVWFTMAGPMKLFLLHP